MTTFTIPVSDTDFILGSIISAGVFAGWLAFLIVSRPSHRHSADGVKLILFGIIFSLISSILFHLICGAALNELPGRLHYLFLWFAAFLPALILSVMYSYFIKRFYDTFELE